MDKNHKWKYNYILYNMENGYKWDMYRELKELPNVRMCRGALPMNEPLLHKLHKIHWSEKINSKIKLPFKKLWFKKMTDGKFSDDKPVCFILYGGQYGIRDPRLLDYIKKINPENKIAVHYRDLMKSDAKHIDMLKEKTDLIYTYDRGDAEKYGLHHYDAYVYSRMAETTKPQEFDYDLFFVGYAKDRLPLIHNIYQKAVDNNLRCKFIIVGVNECNKINGDGIEYLDHVIPYSQVVEYVIRSKCILEITQENAEGATMRTAEAIVYQRKLMSNCKRTSERPHYNKSHMREFSTADDFDIEFIKEPIPYEELSNTESFSPINELLFVENHFSDIKE